MSELNPKQERFCLEYMVDMNATRAADVAGYKQARVQGPRLLLNVAIKQRIDALKDKQAAKAIITADRTLQELARLATCDISLAFDDNGNLLDIQEMPEDVRRAIAGIEVEIERAKDGTELSRTKKIKFWDKNKSLETIARHLKMLTDKTELTGRVTLEQIIAAVNEKIEKDHPDKK